MLYQLQVNLAGLPVAMVMLSNGNVVFVPLHGISAIFDQNPGQVNAVLFDDEFYLIATDGYTVEDYSYRVQYPLREHPLLVTWLKSLNLQLPRKQE